MVEFESTNKYFGQALRQLLDDRKLTYRDFAKKSNVSTTYLSRILVHNVTPSRDIIEKIALALKIDPNYFKEWRIMKIVEKLEKYYYGLTIKDIEKIEKLLEVIEKKLPQDTKSVKLNSKGADGYSPVYMLDISEFNYMQKRTLLILNRDYKEINKKKKIKEVESKHSFLKDEYEYNMLLEKYNHLNDFDRKEQATNDYFKIHWKDYLKKEK